MDKYTVGRRYRSSKLFLSHIILPKILNLLSKETSKVVLLASLMFVRYTIFATHMENISELATIYPNVKILHFYVDIRNNRLDFKVEFLCTFTFYLSCALTAFIY